MIMRGTFCLALVWGIIYVKTGFFTRNSFVLRTSPKALHLLITSITLPFLSEIKILSKGAGEQPTEELRKILGFSILLINLSLVSCEYSVKVMLDNGQTCQSNI